MHDEMQDPATPSEADMRAAMEEQMRQLHVDDVILQTVVTLVNLAGRRLGLGAEPGEDLAGERDLGQARTAIDSVRALTPFVADSAQADALREAMSQLQMAYAREAGAGAPPAAEGGGEPAGDSPREGGQPATEQDDAAAKAVDEAERARARAKIWTPGSS